MAKPLIIPLEAAVQQGPQRQLGVALAAETELVVMGALVNVIVAEFAGADGATHSIPGKTTVRTHSTR